MVCSRASALCSLRWQKAPFREALFGLRFGLRVLIRRPAIHWAGFLGEDGCLMCANTVPSLPKVKLILYDWEWFIFVGQWGHLLLRRKLCVHWDWFTYLFRAQLFIQCEPNARWYGRYTLEVLSGEWDVYWGQKTGHRMFCMPIEYVTVNVSGYLWWEPSVGVQYYQWGLPEEEGFELCLKG